MFRIVLLYLTVSVPGMVLGCVRGENGRAEEEWTDDAYHPAAISGCTLIDHNFSNLWSSFTTVKVVPRSLMVLIPLFHASVMVITHTLRDTARSMV